MYTYWGMDTLASLSPPRITMKKYESLTMELYFRTINKYSNQIS